MLKKFSPTIMFLVLAGLFLAGCNPAASPSPGSRSGASATKIAAPAPKVDWQQKWDGVVADARKEGTVTIYTTWAANVRIPLIQPLKEKYGIGLEISPFTRPPEILVKLQAEQRAGLYLVDVIGGGVAPALGSLKPAGLLGPLEPLLVLPEVKDSRLWTGEKFPFVDTDKTYVGMIFGKQIHIVYNTDMIKDGEIATYRDVLKPQYRGKITLNDPSVAGVGNAFMSHLAYNLWTVDEAREFLRRLTKEQEVVIERDGRLHVEAVARGKYAIGLAPRVSSLSEFMRMGALLAVVDIKEGTQISYGSGGISVPARLAHPNATAVFVNWLLTKEGQTIYSMAYGSPSMRSDVSTDGLLPAIVARAGEKLFVPAEGDHVREAEMMRIAQRVIEESRK